MNAAAMMTTEHQNFRRRSVRVSIDPIVNHVDPLYFEIHSHLSIRCAREKVRRCRVGVT
jgi:hypothetical protein